MLIAKEAPFEKLTPEACNTALPVKLRAPDGSTILEKLEKGEPKLLAGGRFGGSMAKDGRPAPNPALAAPPATRPGGLLDSMSLREKLGFGLREGVTAGERGEYSLEDD
jgi:hypothetical protein